MKKFAVKIFRFFFLWVILIVIIEILISIIKDDFFSEESLSEIYNQEHNEYKWINKLSNDSIVLIAGASTVKYGLSCTQLNELSNNKYAHINIGWDARDAVSTYYILKKLDLTKVKKVHFGLDDLPFGRRYYLVRNKCLYMDLNYIQTLKYQLFLDHSIHQKRAKTLLYHLLDLEQEKLITPPNNTIPKDFGSAVISKQHTKAPLVNKFQLQDFGWSPIQFKHLKKIETLCKKNNIKFTCFTPPKRGDYLTKCLNNWGNPNLLFYKKMVEYDIKAPIFGNLYEYSTVDDESLFQDAYHLNEEGQSLYTTKFYKQTLNPHTLTARNYLRETKKTDQYLFFNKKNKSSN